MLRTALTPKWLGLLGLVIAVMVGFAFLGRWQLDVAQERGVIEATQEAAAKPSTPLLEVIRPDGSFPEGGLDRKVSFAGTYDGSKQILVSGRKLGDRQGFWVVTPLTVEGSQGRSGQPALMPVLRGFVADARQAPAPPAGRVEVHGTLAQSEPPPNQFRALPQGQVQTINVPQLLNRWGADMFNAFVFADAGPGSGALATAPGEGGDGAADLRAVAPPAAGVAELNWRNFGYALQWFFFGGFALYMWWRMVREDARLAALARDDVGADAGAVGGRAERGATPSPVPDVPTDGEVTR